MNEEKEKVEEISAEVKRETEETAAAAGTPHPSSALRETADATFPIRGRAPAGAGTPPVSCANSPLKDEAKEEDGEMEKLREELASVRGQLMRMEHERYLLSRGVPEEDLDYYAFKIEHMDGAGDDFKKAAKEYLKAHPIRRTTVSSGAELGAGSGRKAATSSELMNQLLRNR